MKKLSKLAAIVASLALAMCVIFGFVACGGEDEGSGNSSSSSSSSTTSYYISFETANFAVESDSQMVTGVSSVEKKCWRHIHRL